MLFSYTEYAGGAVSQEFIETNNEWRAVQLT